MDDLAEVNATFAPSAAAIPGGIPTVAEWALVLLSLLMMAVACGQLRRAASRSTKVG
jgi:hypothetical protein